MGLKQTTTFEAEDDTGAEGLETSATPVTPTSTAVTAPVAGGALTAQRVVTQNVLSGMKDAFRVEFDSVPRILAVPDTSPLQFKDTEEKLGDQIKVQLLSYQDSWVCGPNDKKAEPDTVKYSDDGVTTRDGVSLADHLADLKAQGWSKATIQHRCVIVGELLEVNGKNGSERLNTLVQLDLPPTAFSSFKGYQLQASFQVAKGRKTAEEAAVLTIKAEGAKNKGGEAYVKMTFLPG